MTKAMQLSALFLILLTSITDATLDRNKIRVIPYGSVDFSHNSGCPASLIHKQNAHKERGNCGEQSYIDILSYFPGLKLLASKINPKSDTGNDSIYEDQNGLIIYGSAKFAELFDETLLEYPSDILDPQTQSAIKEGLRLITKDRKGNALPEELSLGCIGQRLECMKTSKKPPIRSTYERIRALGALTNDGKLQNSSTVVNFIRIINSVKWHDEKKHFICRFWIVEDMDDNVPFGTVLETQTAREFIDIVIESLRPRCTAFLDRRASIGYCTAEMRETHSRQTSLTIAAPIPVIETLSPSSSQTPTWDSSSSISPPPSLVVYPPLADTPLAVQAGYDEQPESPFLHPTQLRRTEKDKLLPAFLCVFGAALLAYEFFPLVPLNNKRSRYTVNPMRTPFLTGIGLFLLVQGISQLNSGDDIQAIASA